MSPFISKRLYLAPLLAAKQSQRGGFPTRGLNTTMGVYRRMAPQAIQAKAASGNAGSKLLWTSRDQDYLLSRFSKMEDHVDHLDDKFNNSVMVANLKADLKTDMAKMSGDIGKIYGELKADRAKYDGELKANRAKYEGDFSKVNDAIEGLGRRVKGLYGLGLLIMMCFATGYPVEFGLFVKSLILRIVSIAT